MVILAMIVLAVSAFGLFGVIAGENSPKVFLMLAMVLAWMFTPWAWMTLARWSTGG